MTKGWLILLIFSLIRIAGASLELATIGFLKLISLRTAAVFPPALAFSPLLLIALGLLHGISKGINKEYHTFI
jgi:hypothetical protein